MKAVFDFGDAWIESSNKLTLHDPLAAASIFHSDLCQFEKGFVDVETDIEAKMGATTFTADPSGNVEVARTVDKERFYRVLAITLNDRELSEELDR